jgi:inhibitor of cysteine peptidase
MKKSMCKKFLVIACVLPLLLGGCLFKGKDQALGNRGQDQLPPVGENFIENDENEKEENLNKFASEGELREFLENNTGGSGYSNWGRNELSMLDFGSVDGSASFGDDLFWGGGATKEAAPRTGSDDYSKTNIQVEGVDEADMIKTDGEYIYAIVKNDLFIVKAYPADNAEVLAKIEFKSRPRDMYISGKRLAIFGQDTDFARNEAKKIWPGRDQFTFFKIFDISDPKNPADLRSLNFEGSYHNSRMIGDHIYFITQNNSYRIMDKQPILPLVLEKGKQASLSCGLENDCAWPDVYYFDLPYHSYRWTAINSINIKDAEAKIGGSYYLMENNQNMYASLNNIYIAYTKRVSESELAMETAREIIYPRLNASDRERIEKIEAVDNFILNKAEKLEKIAGIIERYSSSFSEEEEAALEKEFTEAVKRKYKDVAKEMEKTVIHKIAVDNGRLEYKAAGEVSGQILNQFSMDENGGYFRIATTKNRTWSQFVDDESANLSYSNLYILDENLKPVGAVEELAPDERIYSVRFMQNRAYMVTFKQIDPLFVIDLSNPADPKVLGELKIPGFSNYLHPYDDNHIIGIGKDAKENQWGGATTLGIKLSLFNVSDVANPKEVDNYVLGGAGSDSIALHDHKAFLFDRKKNLLAIPASINEPVADSRRGRLTFSGAVVFNVDEKGFELKGKIDHSEGGQASKIDYWRGVSYYDNSVKRSLYIDDVLYTFSNKYLKMNKLDGLDEVKALKMEKEGGGDHRVVN